jgi:2-hydroxychromene-2-carboxylate isomerase
MSTLDFWYDFASTYSYPAAMRIEAAAEQAGVPVRWRPFLLGPIFAAQGMTTSPFNLYPVKGQYMWRDLQRICAALGLPWQQPAPFPQRSILAARAALAVDDAARPAFTRAVYVKQFGEGRDIADPATIAAALESAGIDATGVLAKAESQPIKDALKRETEDAQTRGIFGAPTLITADGELFWGNDRLDTALAWAKARAAA